MPIVNWPTSFFDVSYLTTYITFFDDFVTSSYNSRIWSVTGTGSVTSIDNIGGRQRIRANANSAYAFDHGNMGAFSVEKNANITWLCSMTPATGSGGLCECGFRATTNPTTNMIKWQYSPNANANFRCICTSGGISTTVISDITGNNNDNEFRIECATGAILFYINGVLKATINTNIPTGNLQPFANCNGSSTTVSDLNADWINAIGSR
jgi:hypothetical protein